ncbi:5'(3')-deoxyribonucleotidase [mine drainage metagenome]|uniref:5'(3')-deoxyribonucleotidase n=1 Tax=mine drainage metagenome TaxID=410659 RepID=T1A4W5_9ZZZZ
MLLLVDQDNVLVDFTRVIYTEMCARGHRELAPPPAKQSVYPLEEHYPPELLGELKSIYTAEGFFRSLPPIEGAVQAVKEMVIEGIDVRICTHPIQAYRNCVGEKYEWVERHLGAAYTTRMILTRDKTIIAGDALIDDNPDISGSCTPSWQHIVFDQPYNRTVAGPRLKSWANWRAAIEPMLASTPRRASARGDVIGLGF